MTRRDLFVASVSVLAGRMLSSRTGGPAADAIGRQAASSPSGGGQWWTEEPVRLLQTNLRETDSALDAARLVRQIAEFPANALLINLGGIVAQYPTRVDFHYASAHLPPGRDLFGDVLRDAHARRIRVIGRFDFSKTQKPVFDAHPEWFFRRTTGEPAIYNGLYSACINGAYYRAHAIAILKEALARYDVDGLFFNMFGNPSTDYSGQPMGPCHCDACKTAFQARYGRALPTATAGSGSDPAYGEFLAASAREVAALFADVIHRARPRAAFLTYIQAHTDAIVSESNTAVGRALPLWPYSASDNVNRARTSEPGKMALNLCMSFVDFPWRFVTVPQAEIQTRLYQNLAHGGPPAMAMLGTMDQEDRQALLAARPVFQWHAQHEDLYVGQEHAARVLLMRGQQASYRGFFRLLTEQHIPFVVSDNLAWIDRVDAPGSASELSNPTPPGRGDPRGAAGTRDEPAAQVGSPVRDATRATSRPGGRFDLVIAPSGAPADVARYVRRGGRLLIAGAAPPTLPVGKVIARRPHTQGSWRVHRHANLPSLKDTDLLLLDGEYVEMAPIEPPLLTLIPPAMFGPPEKVWVDKVETQVPGLLFADHEEGRIAYIPWDVGGLYYRHSSQGHAGLMIDVIDRLLPRGRPLHTSAHPLVEITVMRQPARQRTLVHFVNLSGHADTAYFAPIEMRDITVDLASDLASVAPHDRAFTRATVASTKQGLKIERAGAASRRFTLPRLAGYEVVVLE